jgi:hypothetical protein
VGEGVRDDDGVWVLDPDSVSWPEAVGRRLDVWVSDAVTDVVGAEVRVADGDPVVDSEEAMLGSLLGGLRGGGPGRTQ